MRYCHAKGLNWRVPFVSNTIVIRPSEAIIVTESEAVETMTQSICCCEEETVAIATPPNPVVTPCHKNNVQNIYPHSEEYIDSHCHLDFLLQRGLKFTTMSELRRLFPSAFPRVFGGCIANFIRPSFFLSKKKWIECVIECPEVLGSTWGVHPHHADELTDQLKGILKRILSSRDTLKVVAIGECGLDYSNRNHVQKNVQLECFEWQAQLAHENSLPIVIHCREGTEDPEETVLQVLTQTLGRYHPIHRHCFTRSAAVARHWIDTFPHVVFGFTPACIHSRTATQTIRSLPMKNIVLETDAPFFKPSEFNELYSAPVSIPPAAVSVAAHIGHVKGLPIDEVIRATRQNAERLYGVNANIQ